MKDEISFVCFHRFRYRNVIELYKYKSSLFFWTWCPKPNCLYSLELTFNTWKNIMIINTPQFTDSSSTWRKVKLTFPSPFSYHNTSWHGWFYGPVSLCKMWWERRNGKACHFYLVIIFHHFFLLVWQKS